MSLLPLVLALGSAAGAPVLERGAWSVDLAGDVKTFAFSAFPYDWYLVPDEALQAAGMEPVPLMPEDPLAMGALDGRLKLGIRAGEHLELSAHARSGASWASQSLEAGMLSLGAGGAEREELLDLSWEPVRAPDYAVEGRMDRLFLRLSIPHLDLTLGRQPISFGAAWFFTPMDLIAPFSPTDVDQEYKPGVDAARADAYVGQAGHVSAVAAWAGGRDLEGAILALQGGATLGVTDLGLLAALNRAEPVLGLSGAGSLGPVGWHGEATLTLPADEDPFVRAVLGADHAWDRVSLSGEVYAQTLGAADSTGYFELYASERYLRGELWTAGRWYAALSGSFELTPLVRASAFAVVNLADPSALLGPSLSWSAAGNAELAAGAFFGLGRRPADLALSAEDAADLEGLMERADAGSEFGLVPAVAFVETKLYF